MHIIAYTWEAEHHCITCTQHKWRLAVEAIKHVRKPEFWREQLDANEVPVHAIDREGNTVQPVFSTDEHGPIRCGTCREEVFPTIVWHFRRDYRLLAGVFLG